MERDLNKPVEGLVVLTLGDDTEWLEDWCREVAPDRAEAVLPTVRRADALAAHREARRRRGRAPRPPATRLRNPNAMTTDATTTEIVAATRAPTPAFQRQALAEFGRSWEYALFMLTSPRLSCSWTSTGT
jgi:hypothetical protein